MKPENLQNPSACSFLWLSHAEYLLNYILGNIKYCQRNQVLQDGLNKRRIPEKYEPTKQQLQHKLSIV